MATRSAAQKRATAKMLAANRARRSAKKATAKPAKRRASRAASKPAPARAVSRPAPAPAKPASRARRAAGRARAVAGKAMTLGKPLVDEVAIPAVIGAGAASATDMLYGIARKWMPERLTTGAMKHAVKAAVGVGACIAAQKMGVKPKHAKAAAVGILTVGLHRVVNEQIEARTAMELDGVSMTVGALGAALPGDEELNGLEALGALAAGDASLGAALEYAA
ncbi:MAG: hypothetical protein K0S46_2205 [Moraxellaceae bacterium]|jgi:hypothetical protein|nr:hypothetical protein [Moraxellaceae bacterium]